MVQTFFISDTHFSHEATWRTFKGPDGKPLRPFTSTEQMDDYMIEQWNRRVKAEDKVYHLGDVTMQKKHLKILDKLNGRKTLIAGNHDIYNTDIYLKYFDNVRAYKMFPKHGIVCSHIPVHPSQLEYKFSWNVHGHLHPHRVMRKTLFGKKFDPRYFNICVEHIDYTPITFDEILEKLGT